MNERSRVAELSLVVIAAIWGLTFVMVQDAVERLAVMTFLAYRFLPACVLVALAFRRQLAGLSRAGWGAGAVMGVFLTAGYVFQTLGLQLTTAAKAGFITGLFVVLTPVFGALFFRQRAGWPAWAAAGASTIGLYLLSGGGSGGTAQGDLLVLGCAASFAFHILFTGRAVERHHAGALLAVQLGVCGVATLVAAAAAGDLAVPRTAVVWNALIVTSLGATALGFFVQTYAQKHASPARTALILASEPAFAGIFAYLLTGETLNAAGWAGAGLIMAAIVGVELVPYLRPPAEPLPER
ncbi:MAG TPA: DMT family transporter [Actinomycetota bacterium]|nr:DMT family transporter [Actinomycetota bacterium]